MPLSPPRNTAQSSRSFSQPAQAQPQTAPGRLYDAQGNKTGARIDGRVRAATLMGGGDQGQISKRGQFWAAAQTPPQRTRADNIAAARADGTFDAKRNAFNAANQGSYMDEAGNIGPRAPLPTGNPNQERVPVTTPSTPTTPTAAKPEVMGPPRPAKFMGKDGKWQSREEFFGDAAKRQGVDNAYAKAAAPVDDLEKRAAALQQAFQTAAKGKALVEGMKAAKPAEMKTSGTPTTGGASPATDAAAKPETKLTPPHLLFANRAPKPETTPAKPGTAYNASPNYRSIMTGKTKAQEAEEEEKAERKEKADRLFRTQYNPYSQHKNKL